jgi:adenosylcobinamide-phosphate synthase
VNQIALACLAFFVEGLVGYPPALYRKIGHPVGWIGKLISYLDEGLNDPDVAPASNRLNGVMALAALVIAVALPAWLIARGLSAIPFGYLINALFATTLIAQKSMGQHVGAVGVALSNSLPQARLEVAKIVGRDTSTLDESGIAKAALESLAENTSDGIVAPIFWYAVAGLPGIAIYKAINTADSMIGHKSEKYFNFGWAAARLDDLVNLPASRLTGALFCAAAFANGKAACKSAWESMWGDAGKHNSPNAGWPEAAMAGALGLKFGGPRQYQGEEIYLPTMGDGRTPAGVADINAGLSLYKNAMASLFVLGVILAIAL